MENDNEIALELAIIEYKPSAMYLSAKNTHPRGTIRFAHFIVYIVFLLLFSGEFDKTNNEWTEYLVNMFR